MIDYLICFYNSEFSFLQVWRSLKSFMKVLLILSFVFYVVINIFTAKHARGYLFFSLSLSILLSILHMYYLLKKYYKKKFGCKTKIEIRKARSFNIILHIEKLGIEATADKVDSVIKLLDDTIKEAKPLEYTKSGIVALLLTPLWLGFISRGYALSNSLIDAFQFFYSWVIILILVYIIFFKPIKTIYREIAYSKYNKLIVLRELLVDYQFFRDSKRLNIM